MSTMDMADDALSTWSSIDVFRKLYSALPSLTDLQSAQLQLAGVTGAELSSATAATVCARFKYLTQDQVDHLWQHVKQLQLLEEHLNQLALWSILQEEQQLLSSAALSSLKQGSKGPEAADTAAAAAASLALEIDSLAQRLADQRLAYSLSLDMAAAAAAAESCRALQQQELQDANTARRLGGLAPLQPHALPYPVADPVGMATISGSGMEALAAAACWKGLLQHEDGLMTGCGSSSRLAAKAIEPFKSSIAGASSSSSSSSSSSTSGASSSGSNRAAAITLTRAMLQQARGQLLVVHVQPHSSAAGACMLSAVYSKHVAGDFKGKAPASTRPPDSLHAEQ
jgi:hypothetical protein